MHAIAPKAVQNFQASGDVYVPWPLDACFQRVPSALDAQGVQVLVQRHCRSCVKTGDLRLWSGRYPILDAPPNNTLVRCTILLPALFPIAGRSCEVSVQSTRLCTLACGWELLSIQICWRLFSAAVRNVDCSVQATSRHRDSSNRVQSGPKQPPS